jgi:hypothetical protein
MEEAMKRSTIASLLVMLAVSAGPVAAATTTYQIALSGKGAQLSAEREIEGGWEYVNVAVADTIIREDGTQLRGSGLSLYHVIFTCGRHTCSGSETFGGAEGVPFTIDRQLETASVAVTIPATRCVIDDRSYECWDVEATVNVTWAGTGAMAKVHGTYSGGEAGVYQYTFRQNGSVRPAAAAGSVDGFDLLTATYTDAQIFSLRYGEIFISHEGG